MFPLAQGYDCNIFLDSKPVECIDAGLTDLTVKANMLQGGWEFSDALFDREWVSPNVEYIVACGSDISQGHLDEGGQGRISANFQGRGYARLVYGNRCTDGHVEVYLDQILISISKEKRTEIAFQYFPGTTLSIKEVDAIVKLHSLSIICFCKYYIRRQILNVIYLNILATILLIANKC